MARRAGGKRRVRKKVGRQSHGVFRDQDGDPVPDGHGGFLPKHCECGGLLEYAWGFGRIWSGCLSCTPVVKIDWRDLNPANWSEEKRARVEAMASSGGAG